jgi:hypothetical protein
MVMDRMVKRIRKDEAAITAEERLEAADLSEINEIIEKTKEFGAKFKAASVEDESGRMAALGFWSTIDKGLRKFNIILMGRVLVISMTLRRDLVSVGKRLGNQDVEVMVICSGAGKEVNGVRGALDKIIKELGNGKVPPDHIFSEVANIYTRLEHIKGWVVQLLALDARIRNELEDAEKKN